MSSKPAECPIGFALEVFGDRWSLIVLRDLMLEGKTRFKEFQASDEGIASNILTDRLKRLEQRALVSKMRDPADARQFLYRPTEMSISLVPMLIEMAAWGMRTNQNSRDDRFLHRVQMERAALIGEIQERIRREIAAAP